MRIVGFDGYSNCVNLAPRLNSVQPRVVGDTDIVPSLNPVIFYQI